MKSASNTVLSVVIKAAVIVFVAIDFIAMRRSIESTQAVVMIFLSVTVLMSLMMFVKKNENTMMNISVFGIMCGLFVLQKSFDGYDASDYTVVVLSALESAFGVIMIYLNILLYGGSRYNQMRLFVISGITIFLLLFVPLIYIGFKDAYLGEAIMKYPADFALIAVLIFYMAVLSRPQVKYYSLNKQMAYNIKTLNSTLFLDSDAYMLRSEFVRFLNTEWNASDDVGVVGTKSADFVSDGSTAKVVLKKCDDGNVYGSIFTESNGTSIQTPMLPVKQIVYEGDENTCDRFTLYGEDGFFVVLKIKDDVILQESRLLRIYYWITGYPYE